MYINHFLTYLLLFFSGKTATLVALIELLVRLGQSVLITSHTHSAIDNVLRRLPDNILILRLGPLSRLHPDIHAYSEHHITASTPEELEDIFNSKVGVFCKSICFVFLLDRKIFIEKVKRI